MLLSRWAIVNAEPVEEKGVDVCELRHSLVQRVSEAVATLRHAEEHWLAGRGCCLKTCRHLLRVVGVHPWVELTGGEQHRRVRRAVLDVVVRRVSAHRTEQLWILD